MAKDSKTLPEESIAKSETPFSGLSVEKRRAFLLEELPQMLKSGAVKSNPESLFEMAGALSASLAANTSKKSGTTP